MSALEASSEHAPSKLTPHGLALDAQTAIERHQTKAGYEAGLIRQLMIGRHVRKTDPELSHVIYLVKEVRMSLGWRATLWGICRGQRTPRLIGPLHEIEVVETGEPA